MIEHDENECTNSTVYRRFWPNEKLFLLVEIIILTSETIIEKDLSRL
jgi:hypothetical protein